MTMKPPYDQIGDELLERLVAYTDGRLEPSEVPEVEQLIAADPVVKSLVADLRDTGDEIRRVLGRMDKDTPSPHLVELVMTHPMGPMKDPASAEASLEPDATLDAADAPPAEGTAEVVPLPGWRRWRLGLVGGGLLAASVAVGLVIVAAQLSDRLTELQTAGQQLQQQVDRLTADLEGSAADAEQLATARAEVERLRTALAESDTARNQAEAALEGATATVGELDAGRTQLDQQVTQLTAEVRAIEVQLQQRQTELASARTEIEQLNRTLGSTEADNTRLQSDLAAAEGEFRGARAELQQSVDRLAEEAQSLEGQLAEGQRQLAAAEAQVADLMTAFVSADTTRADLAEQVAELNAETENLAAALQQRTQQLQVAMDENWTTQVAQYHRVHTALAPDFLVEVPASDKGAVGDLLDRAFGRPVAVPNLAAFDLDFAGLRILVVDGMPVAQLMYLDPENEEEPLAFCFMRNMTGPLDLTEHQDGELNLVEWRDNDYRYVVVGSAPLEALAQALQQNYEL